MKYIDIPYYYIYSKKERLWKPRKTRSDQIISRLYSVSPNDYERYALRLLLLHVHGAQNWEDLKTVDNCVQSTFKDAAVARQLLHSYDVWKMSMKEVVEYKMPSQLRYFFSYIIVFSNPSNISDFWEEFKGDLTEDHRRQYSAEISENMALNQIFEVLRLHGVQCNDLPQCSTYLPNDVISYANEANLGKVMYNSLNDGQRHVVDLVLNSLGTYSCNKCFFLEGEGGSGKTYVYSCLYHILNGQKRNCIVASYTGIAATLLPGGRTLHSVFKIPIPILENSVSRINPTSSDAQYLKSVSLIIIDEAPMAPNLVLKVINQLLCDIMNNKEPFGGKTIFMGGDFRQVLPVTPYASKTQIIESSIKRSELWNCFKHLQLSENMRILAKEKEFCNWLSQLGNGTLQSCEKFGKMSINFLMSV